MIEFDLTILSRGFLQAKPNNSPVCIKTTGRKIELTISLPLSNVKFNGEKPGSASKPKNKLNGGSK